jgi:hypothetical protein
MTISGREGFLHTPVRRTAIRNRINQAPGKSLPAIHVWGVDDTLPREFAEAHAKAFVHNTNAYSCAP